MSVVQAVVADMVTKEKQLAPTAKTFWGWVAFVLLGDEHYDDDVIDLSDDVTDVSDD